jgi:hypothetical protein
LVKNLNQFDHVSWINLNSWIEQGRNVRLLCKSIIERKDIDSIYINNITETQKLQIFFNL